MKKDTWILLLFVAAAAAAYFLVKDKNLNGGGFGGGGIQDDHILPVDEVVQIIPPPGGVSLPPVSAPYAPGTTVGIISGGQIVAKRVVPAAAPYAPRTKTTFSLTPTPVPRIVQQIPSLLNLVTRSQRILTQRAMSGSKPISKIITPVPRIVQAVPALQKFIQQAQKTTYYQWRMKK